MKTPSVKSPATDAFDQLDSAIIVGLGSNLGGIWGSPTLLLDAALKRLEEKGLQALLRSSWWRSRAWPNSNDPEFTNGVAMFSGGPAPQEVLELLLEVEQEFGRARDGPNLPRTLDLDLIAHGRTVVRSHKLTLPHPRAHKRLFVMGPLAEIAPLWRHPISGALAVELADRASVGLDAQAIGRPALHKTA